MLFLINNPIIAFIILAVLGLTVLTVSKIVNEIKLNRDLNIKQTSMRLGSIRKNPFGKRMSILGAQALAPVAVVVIAFVVGVNLQTDTTPPINFQTVSSSDDIIELFTDFNDKFSSGYTRNFFNAVDDLEMAMDGAEAPGDKGTGSDDYSGTNNQVIGVDEMDNVLTDGKFIYTISSNGVQITLAYTEEQGPDVLSLYKEISYSSDYCSGDYFNPIGIYVDNDQLIVIGNQYKYNCSENDEYREMYDIWWGGYYSSSNIQVKVYDKEADFVQTDEYEMNGYFTGTRKIDNNLYIVTNNYIPFYQEDINVDNYLPYYSVNEAKIEATYDQVNYVDGTNPNAFTTFYGINLDTKEVDMEVVLGDSGYNLYVSNSNIYLVGSVYYFWPLIDVIEVENPVQSYKTAIMRVAIDDGTVDFNGTGYVEGHTLDQFSMDEYDGYLRIATTSGWWGEDINNRITILDENLEVSGVIENLGKKGETIQSTRFVGEYGYVVTFLRTDPFYVIDLNNPEKPVKEGELEITGFSTYLQPLSNDYMLGIGFEANNEGRTTGLKVSIYDISDKSNPTPFDEVVFDYENFGYAWSSATYEHKDLLVSLSKGLIALPFTTWGYDELTSEHSYNSGVVVLKFDLENGFNMKDTIPTEPEELDYDYIKHEENSDWNCYVYKAKFIDEYFYTISTKYIKVARIEELDVELGSVTIKEDN